MTRKLRMGSLTKAIEKDTIVIDLDGTLANVEHRTHLVRQANPDWDQFYEKCDEDGLNEWCVELMGCFYSQNTKVVIVSGRRQSELRKTKSWLKKHEVPYDELHLLRADNDFTPDHVLKKKWLEGYGKDRILFVVDDRQRVVDMWREEGLVCLQCYAWEEYKKAVK